MDSDVEIPASSFVTELSPRSVACSTVEPGQRVRFETSDEPYRQITGREIDSGRVDFRTLNRLTGPVAIAGAEPGDALGFLISDVKVAGDAHVLFNAAWRSEEFPLSKSQVDHFPIEVGHVVIDASVRMPLQSMVGCIATAPDRGLLSSLSPCRSTGGNLDLPQIASGATVWLPVRVEGGMLALGDLHASMGAGEPVGCGLECGGVVTGRVFLAKSAELPGVRIETSSSILFVGSDHDNRNRARTRATRAAWNWLVQACGLDDTSALAVCAGLLDLHAGGPAGANEVAGFSLQALRESGVSPRLLSTMK